MPYTVQLRGNPNLETLVFEHPEHYDFHNSHGFWGAVESSIDWCERNYQISHYIAEYYNTVSNIVLLIFGVWGLLQCRQQRLEVRYVAVYAGIAIIGVGSAMFHGMLSHVGQQVRFTRSNAD